MKYRKFKHPFIAAIGSFLVGLIGITGCTGSIESSFVLATFSEPGPPPTEVTVDQLYAEYMTDEAAADAKYKWERLLFTEVDVEEVVGKIYVDQHGDPVFLNDYFISGHIKFVEVQDFFIVMQNVKEGYVLNITGDCQGLIQGFVYISDCWLESVVGDLGKGGSGVEFY